MLKRVLLAVLYSAQVLSVNLLLLKGTTEVLPENLKKYALYHGVPFAEKLAENYYIASPRDIMLRIDHEIENTQQSESDAELAKSNLEQYKKDLESGESYTSRLLSQLYYRPVDGQFQLTAARNNPAFNLKPGHIGNILKIIDQSKGKGKIDLEADLKDYLDNLKFEKASGSVFKPKDFNPLVRSLIGSLDECDISNTQAIFAPGTTVGILLGYCLNKSNTKEDLQDYLAGLTGQESITLPDQQYSQQELNQIIAQGIQLENTDKFADWLTCLTYQIKYQAPFPKIVSNKAVVYDGVNFADCVETTVRNLCNITTYNGASLGVAAEGIELSESLKEFYQMRMANVPAEVGNQLVHQTWTDLIENMSGVSYNRLKLKGGSEISFLPSGYEGFMPVDDNLISQDELAKLSPYNINIGGQIVTLYQKSVGDVKYLLVLKNSGLLCYELLPTASNMVVCLNNLFKLNLYDSPAIFSQDFAQSNFKKVCNKLGWDLKTPVTDNVKSIDIKICKYSTCFAVKLFNKAHGAVTVLNSVTSTSINQDVITVDLYKKYPEKISEIISLLDDTVDIKVLFEKVDKNQAHFLQLLRNINVINSDRKLDVIKNVFDLNIKNNLIDDYLADLIMGLPLNDQHYIRSILQNDINFTDKVKNTLKSFGNLYFLKEGFSEEVVIIFCNLGLKRIVDSKDILAFLEKVMAIGHKYVQESVIYKLSNLVEKKVLDSEQVVAFLEKVMTAGNDIVQASVVDVLRNLVEKKVLNSHQVIAFLEKGMATGNESVQALVIKQLSNLFVTKALNSDQVIAFLEKGMATGNDIVQASVVDVLSNLVEKKVLNSHHVIAFLEKGIATGNERVKVPVISNLSNLVKKNALDSRQIVTLSKKIMGSSSTEVQIYLMNTLDYLKNKGILTSQEIEKIKTREYVGIGKGLFGKTGILSMRQDPYALSDYMADWAGKLHAGYFEKLKQEYQSQTPESYYKHLDLEFERQKILEQQQRMEDIYRRWYEAEYPIQGGNVPAIQNRMPVIGQQQQTGAIPLPKVGNVPRIPLIRRGIR